MRYFTSDTHFYHKGIMTYCSRPWADMDAMRIGLIDKWNAVVKPEDDVYVLGDLCFAGAKVHEALIPALNGRKHLVKGNHDGFPARRYLAWGFVEVIDHSTKLTLSDGREVLLCHYPYISNDDRYPERLPKDEGLMLLHGHVHQAWLYRGRGLNVGVDVWGYEPVSEEQVIDSLTKLAFNLAEDTPLVDIKPASGYSKEQLDTMYEFFKKHGSD